MLKILIIMMLFMISNDNYAKERTESECKKESNVYQNAKAKYEDAKAKKEYEKSKLLEKLAYNKIMDYQICRSGKNIYVKHEYLTDDKYKNEYYKKKYKEELQNNTVSIKSIFKEEKRKAWLEYYKRPQDCIKPKSTAKFAKCLNDRDTQANKFDVSWSKKKH